MNQASHPADGTVPAGSPHPAGPTRGPAASVLVVGGGVAGFAAVRELRRLGHTGALTLVDPEGLPYDRPPLSKEYLTGDADPGRLLLAPPDWFAEHRVRVLTARAVRLDLSGPRPAAELDDGTRCETDMLVLAPGGRPRPLAVPGGDHPDLLVLRTRADADRLAAGLHLGARVVVIGAGFTGSEVASAAREALADVTLVTTGPAPSSAALGPALAERVHREHTRRGVRVVEGLVIAVEHDAGTHRVCVRHPDGGQEVLEADTVVAAVGIEPDVSLAEAAGLETDRGILVDAHGRTSHPAVYAVGDAAERRAAGTVTGAAADDGAGAATDAVPDTETGTVPVRAPAPVTHTPTMHWEPAMRSGAAAAAAILGEPVPDAGAPWFWSDRHGMHLEGVGTMLPPAGGCVVDRLVHGEPVASFALDADGLLVGAASLDDPTVVRAARRLIDRRIPVDPARLADPEVPVRSLLRG
ncbi:NAD(P)/FAD-dependent oxidoreductase [Micrococcus sp.]|uniref:NAD(P)/FAD-dependent oxidoreductase n=1 Tax=Micrococcus sp. TaxID=1271 RepID=UPI002A914594|nr:FAD-dependent oxidoreductase [Micrococcus sp.]MDY6054939.1 FAD-dependent oxidoreductase [Micrococcus sp.]